MVSISGQSNPDFESLWQALEREEQQQQNQPHSAEPRGWFSGTRSLLARVSGKSSTVCAPISNLQDLAVLSLADTADAGGITGDLSSRVSYASSFTSSYDLRAASPLPVSAHRESALVLRHGDSTQIDVGDVIAFTNPDRTGRIPTDAACQFVVDSTSRTNATVSTATADTANAGLSLRDATTEESNMHGLAFNLDSQHPDSKNLGSQQLLPQQDRNLIANIGQKFLYDTFVQGLANRTGQSQTAVAITLMTCERNSAIHNALNGISPQQCTVQRIDVDECTTIADSAVTIVGQSNSRPTLVEKGVFREDIGLLVKQGDHADLQPGDVISIRRLFEFSIIKSNTSYWLRCSEAPPQCGDLKGETFRLGGLEDEWSVNLSRDYFGVQGTGLISSQQGEISHSPQAGLHLILPKDQTTLWIGIKRPHTTTTEK
jgi:hypothetical protein